MGERQLVLSRPFVMGILNVTPDSFSDGGEHDSYVDALSFAEDMLRDGADIIDVGGESTRPGSDPVEPSRELARVLPVVRELASRGIIVSIDTRHAEVAAECVAAGAMIINDITGFADPSMIEVAASCDAGLVSMHMLGDPKSMQSDPRYSDVMGEITTFLLDSAARLEAAGIDSRRICFDPGPGFGKNAWHNMRMLGGMGKFAGLGYPLLAAFSRKATLGKVSGIDEASLRSMPSAAAAVLSFSGGARIFRVHDVAQTVQALKVASNSAFAAFGAVSSTLLPGSRAFVALGSNMGDPVANILGALEAIDSLPNTSVIASSSVYRTEPAYNADQDDFVNSAAWVQTGLSPERLLDSLLSIENDFHRVRQVRNGPRTLDLDLLDYEGSVVDTERLALPHPRILERDFAVTPILELSRAMADAFGPYVHPEVAAGADLMDGRFELADGTPVVRDGIEYGRIVGKVMDASEAWR